MITDKEYPATHSMSTSWFAIDLDGNVAILEFDDNGPVPDGIPETSSEDVFLDTMVEKENGIRTVHWTDDQVEEMLKRMSDFDEHMDLDMDSIVQIDTSQTDCFVQMFSSLPQKSYSCYFVCFSEPKGLYFANFYELTEEQKGKLIRQNIILKYAYFFLNCNNLWNEEKHEVVFENNFDHLPVYLYQQPYWTQFPMRRTYVPAYPLKENQLSEKVREKALRLPFRFDEKEIMQIAQYFPFDASCAECTDDGAFYLLPTEDNVISYFRVNDLPYVWCGRTCNKCRVNQSGKDTHTYSIYQYCEHPTLAVIYGTNSRMEYEWMERWPLLRHAAAIPIIHGYPVPDRGCVGDEADNYVRKHGYKKVLDNCIVYLEKALQTIKPYALILFDETRKALGEYYSIKGNVLSINGIEYPFFMYKDIGKAYEEIRAYAEMPYRGELVNRIKGRDE